MLYGGGIAAVAAGRYDTFAILLTKAMARVENDQSLVLAVNTWEVMEPNIAQQLPVMQNLSDALCEYLFEVLRAPLKDYLPHDISYQEYVDRIEYLVALL